MCLNSLNTRYFTLSGWVQAGLRSASSHRGIVDTSMSQGNHMSEPILSDDGFWEFNEGEWVPTEKQLSALDNGAIPFDAIDNDTIIVTESKPITSRISTFYSNISSEHRLYSFIGICISVLFVSVIIVLASLPINSITSIAVTDCSMDNSFQVFAAATIGNSPLAEEENCPHELEIASWNLKQFGQSDANDDTIVSEIALQISQFDIVAVQEIKDLNPGTAPYILQDEVEHISEYGMVLSNRTGAFCQQKSSSQISEQYAFYYNISTIDSLDSGHHYPNDDCEFSREPFAARFSSVEYDSEFVLITLHVKPDDAVNEISALVNVFEWAKFQYPDEDDFILLGDLNADCNYASPSELDKLAIRDSEYQWIIPDGENTNTAESSTCAYDRIIFSDYGSGEYLDSYSTYCEIEVSDHCIISAKFSAHES